MLNALQWHRHATFSLQFDALNIVIDPWGVTTDDVPTPDVILVTHEDYDHCSPADINKLRTPNTRIIASRGAAAQLDGDITILRPWQVINIGRTSIKAVPAYTYNQQHPMPREDVGFVISHHYQDFYFAGDTAYVPELRSLICDVAVLPVTSRHMPLDDAVNFVKDVRPRYVVPSHIGDTSESASTLETQQFTNALAPFTEVVNLATAAFHSTG